jgi:hypothetical protein
MARKCSRRITRDVAGHGAEDVAEGGGAGDRHDLPAVHRGLERAQRVDLGDDHARAHAGGAGGQAAAAPAVAAHDEPAAGEQAVGRAQDPVDRALAGAVAVVEHVLGRRVSLTAITGQRSTPSRAMARRRVTPLVVSSVPPTIVRGERGVAGVQQAGEVGAVVHDQLRPVRRGRPRGGLK